MNKKSDGWRRVLAIIIDGLLCAFILFVFVTIVTVVLDLLQARYDTDISSWESCWGPCSETDPKLILIRKIIFIFNIVIPFIFIISPVVAHGLIMSIFKGSIGSKIMGITVKNSDGSEAKRRTFLKQIIIWNCFNC